MSDEPEAQALKAGDRHYRAFVGPPANYDLLAATQFSLLTHLGLREQHHLLDVGCGSLRAGRLFIPYLLPGRYFGIEPETWLVEEGFTREVGEDLRRLKRPTFSDVADFRLSVFGRAFDYVLAQSIFSHASRTQIERCLGEAAKVLAPGGVLVATWKDGPSDYAGERWVYPGTVTFRMETIRAMTTAAALVFEPLAWPHPNRQRWFLATRAPTTRAVDMDLESFVGLRQRLRKCETDLARSSSRRGHSISRRARRLFPWRR